MYGRGKNAVQMLTPMYKFWYSNTYSYTLPHISAYLYKFYDQGKRVMLTRQQHGPSASTHIHTQILQHIYLSIPSHTSLYIYTNYLEIRVMLTRQQHGCSASTHIYTQILTHIPVTFHTFLRIYANYITKRRESCSPGNSMVPVLAPISTPTYSNTNPCTLPYIY